MIILPKTCEKTVENRLIGENVAYYNGKSVKNHHKDLKSAKNGVKRDIRGQRWENAVKNQSGVISGYIDLLRKLHSCND